MPIRRSRQRLQALFDHALNTILLMDDRGYFIDANPSAEELLGYRLDEIARLHFTDLTPPPSDSEAKGLWSEFQLAGKQANEFTIRRKDGSMVDIEYRAVRDIQPGVHLVMARDISERKRVEADLAEN